MCFCDFALFILGITSLRSKKKKSLLFPITFLKKKDNNELTKFLRKKKIARASEVCKGRQRHDERGDEMYARMDGKVRQEQKQHKKNRANKKKKRLIHKTAIIMITIAMIIIIESKRKITTARKRGYRHDGIQTRPLCGSIVREKEAILILLCSLYFIDNSKFRSFFFKFKKLKFHRTLNPNGFFISVLKCNNNFENDKKGVFKKNWSRTEKFFKFFHLTMYSLKKSYLELTFASPNAKRLNKNLLNTIKAVNTVNGKTRNFTSYFKMAGTIGQSM
ncbi:hypothetical protein RFI_31248, partial [Reticulomyxa filosa]